MENLINEKRREELLVRENATTLQDLSGEGPGSDHRHRAFQAVILGV